MSKKDEMQFAGGDCKPPTINQYFEDITARLQRVESRLELTDEALRLLLGTREKVEKFLPIVEAIIRQKVVVKDGKISFKMF